MIMLVIASTFAACKSKTETNKKDIIGIDSTSRYKNNIMADTARLEAAAPGTITKRIVETRDANGNIISTTTTTTTVGKSNTTAKTATGSRRTSASTAPAATQTAQRKGWSNRAKGAAIGGVGGAVVGAAVSKKRVKEP